MKKVARYSPENSHNFIYRAVFINNSFFTIPLYKMERKFPSSDSPSCDDTPPAFNTRKRDRAACPSEKDFNTAYQFTQKATLPSRSKSFILGILNRTAPSKRKLFRCKIVTNEVCELCNVVCDNYHLVAECIFSYMINAALKKYLEMKDVALSENTFAFFAPIPNLSYNFNSQIIHILCEIARRAYSTVENERWTRWSGIHFFAQIRSTLLSIITVRKYAGWAYKEVLNFEEFFSSHIDNISELMPLNIGHFRAQPTYSPSRASFTDAQQYNEFVQRTHSHPRIISM